MLTLQPVSLAEANAFVALHHRHHKPVRGHKYSLGCFREGQLVGVAITGRPVSRYLDDGLTLEVNRLCTDGTRNACSFLCWVEKRNRSFWLLVSSSMSAYSGLPCMDCHVCSMVFRCPTSTSSWTAFC